MSEPTQLDWMRLAAYIDGEGSICFNTVKKRGRMMSIRVNVTNTDPRLPQWILKTFGVGRFGVSDRRRKETHRQAFKWNVDCREAEWILRNCFPYLLIKQEHAEIALEFQETICPVGTKLSEETFRKRENLRQRLHALKRINPNFDTTLLEPGPRKKTGPKRRPRLEGPVLPFDENDKTEFIQ